MALNRHQLARWFPFLTWPRPDRALLINEAAAGVTVWPPQFCPQALVSQSAATPTGCDAPMTQPKKRGPVMVARPGSASGSRFASTTTALPASTSSAAEAKRRSDRRAASTISP